MKLKELKDKKDSELKTLINEKHAALSDLRFRIQADNKDTKQSHNLKKDIARANTILRQRKNK